MVIPKSQVKYLDLPTLKSRIFYRESGPVDAPVVLLLHGFPSSSHQYRNLIPLLATKYRVIAPDLPGFGFTEVTDNYEHTFDNLAVTVLEFLDTLAIAKFSVYIFDYGAPTALNLSLKRPEAIQAIITQNGNAYEDGLGDFWNPLRQYWASGDKDNVEIRATLAAAVLTYEATKGQYVTGTLPNKVIAPESYTLDYALLQRPGQEKIQIDLFWDYQNNVKNYPRFQEYFRKSQVPLLAVWGKNDPFFIAPGAEAFKRDLPNAEIHLLDAGHFAVETETEEIGALILEFLKRNGI
ncbi:hydrolase, putative [Talaromyces stipitatus ATCC 10500]|uniref:Hydrolase, putative n=1 Tax=Talaromyces stipitatus (strain ATCC 10500 / CBS 375.48 / QM 6759 / NRRL 1006) TaxID=441959 RepID=B8MNL0_TALSN|nr:hydrolase, putative [Talaromyces stipitatus ATCC 10500]EED14099.1 hydrolase, putative [Talaromyces stipitatus ATCC 10500]